jgi:long-chain acyl-CoA synthetase
VPGSADLVERVGILARGPNIVPGYLNRPDATPETLEGGWLHTGDLGSVDPAGRLRLVGCKKEIIIINNAAGKNITPANIEQAVRGCLGLHRPRSTCTATAGRTWVALVTLDCCRGRRGARPAALHMSTVDETVTYIRRCSPRWSAR